MSVSSRAHTSDIRDRRVPQLSMAHWVDADPAKLVRRKQRPQESKWLLSSQPQQTSSPIEYICVIFKERNEWNFKMRFKSNYKMKLLCNIELVFLWCHSSHVVVCGSGKKIYLRGSFMWIYRSSEIAHKFRIDDVEHITSKAIHVSQNSDPKIQYPEIIVAIILIVIILSIFQFPHLKYH